MNQLERQTFFLLKKMRKALRNHSMIEDGDKILVAVSGGKDSLTLLNLLHANRHNNPVCYDLLAGHVMQEDHLNPDSAILDELRKAGVPYVFEHEGTREGNDDHASESCYACARKRREILFKTAQREGCNKVAFGHHSEDMAETALLNLLYQGRIETLDPVKRFFNGELTVIRPLIYMPEREIMRFAKTSGFSIRDCQCLLGIDSKRARMKEILMTLRKENPNVIANLNRAFERFMTDRKNARRVGDIICLKESESLPIQ